jgi:Fe-S-cluster-containing hydrogenase component 2
LETHLRSVKIFASLIPDAAEFNRFVDFLRPKVRLVRVHPGQVIVRQGDVADHFYMVRSGFVKVSQSRQGIEQVLNYIGPGGYFGEIGLLGHLAETLGISTPGVRVATCSALDHVDLVRLKKDSFLELLEMFPRVRQQIVEVARDNLRANDLQRTQLDRMPLAEFLDQGLMNAGNVLVLDLERCTRCDECTKACADSHGGVTRLIREGLRFDKFLIASSCRSCLDPYCLVGCPVAAIERTDGGDIHIKDTCIGCGKCAENCPYGNINMVGLDTKETTADPLNPGRQIAVQRQKATTCDKCGGIDQPSCVYACPHEAAHRMDGKELLELVRQRNARG